MKWYAFAMFGLLAAACGDPGPTPESEIAAEVRALRASLEHTVAGSRAAVAPPDLAQLTTALSPLREALGALTAQQTELQERQLALTQELTRWSQLLVDSVGTARRDEGTALTARLQQLESAMKDQEVRHRQMETLIQGALDRTADRLDDFLQRLGGAVPDAGVPAPVPPAPAGNATNGAKSIGDAARSRRAAHGGLAWWWSGLALSGAGLGFVCFRRWRKQLPSTGIQGVAPPSVDQGVQEIWAAAALLGEAVGRLRESTATVDGPGPDDGEVAAGTDDAGEFVVLDDELLQPIVGPVPAPGRAAVPPEGTVCRIRTDDPAGAMQLVLQVLGEDPRVLRRPEPGIRCGRDYLEVTFRAVPDLPAGERVHLEQRLRDACG